MGRKALIDKLEKRVDQLLEGKKELERKYGKARCELEEAAGECEALREELAEEQGEFEVQKKRFASEIRVLKTELHKEHEKLKITEGELQESRKKEKQAVQMERVNLAQMSREDLLNCLE